MAGLNIPGVTDQYNTNDTVEKLMKIERVPLTREQNQLESLKTEKNAWRDINTRLSALRDNTKTLYSFENPFNSKLTSSTEEYAVTAEANRSASIQSFKVDVIQAASSDRFLTDELENDFKVPQGTYTYKVGEKQITFNWKGGSLKDFSTAINKRGNNIIKSSIIGASAGKKSLLIEAVPTGKENCLIFEDDAKTFAFDSGMIDKIKSQTQTFSQSQSEILPVNKIEYDEPVYMPVLSLTNTKYDEEKQTATVEPRGAYQVKIPEKILKDNSLHLQFTVVQKETEDITPEINKTLIQPELPDAGSAEYAGIVISNNLSDTNLNLPPEPPAPLEPVKTNSILYAVMEDGSEKEIPYTPAEDEKPAQIDLKLSDYSGIKAIAVRNKNTGTSYEISNITALDPVKDLGYGPKHPVSTADDAIIKYEGITITRPSNKIDDVVPEITLNVHDKTEKTATIAVKPDVDASKNAIIEFVGKYNQAVAELNILSQNKQEIIDELDYLTADEKEAEQKKLGLFQSD